MPSRTALLIATKCESFLNRPLSKKELIGCEELAINYYPKPILKYIEGLCAKPVRRDFVIVYQPIMAGLLRGAYRRFDIVKITSRFLQVYQRFDSFCGEGYPDSDLEAIMQMAEDSTDAEINAAIATSRMKGIHSARYARAVIVGNRQRYMENQLKAGRLKDVLPSKYQIKEYGKIKVPRVDAIREAWRWRVADAKRQIALEQAELNTIRKVRAERSNTGDKI